MTTMSEKSRKPGEPCRGAVADTDDGVDRPFSHVLHVHARTATSIRTKLTRWLLDTHPPTLREAGRSPKLGAMSSRPTAIEALSADPARSGLVLDFDGVLSPIIEDPSASALPDRTASALRRLSRHLGLLAVISGRPVAFLEDRIAIPGVPLLGSYGLERSDDGTRRLDPSAAKWTAQVGEATRMLKVLLAGAPGLRVEEKSVSVAVHWRQAPDHDAAAAEVRRVTARLSAETGLRLEPGKLVEELRPPVEVDKGSVLAGLLDASKYLTTFGYAGDDLGDVPALRKARAAGGYALLVDHGQETDPRLRKLADESYAGSEAFADWLSLLADRVD